MIARTKIVLYVVLLISNLTAQTSFYFSGYAVDLPVYQAAKNTPAYNREVLSFKPASTNRQIVDMNGEITQNKYFILSHYIDRFSFHHEFGFGNFEIGRQ